MSQKDDLGQSRDIAAALNNTAAADARGAAEPTPAPAARRWVFYSGRVQGVGFRYTASSLAAKFAVTGYVKNLADGRVELLCEGAADEIDKFLNAIDRALGGNIRHRASQTSDATGEFSGFNVRY